MKKVKLFFCAIAMISFSVNGASKLGEQERNQSMHDVICKQKNSPIKGEYDAKNEKVKLTALVELTNLKIKNVIGLDGLKVASFEDASFQTFISGSSVEFNVEVEKPKGLSYLNIEFEYTQHNQVKNNYLVIPIGELSRSQMMKRKSNIIELSPKRLGVLEKGKSSKKVHVLGTASPR